MCVAAGSYVAPGWRARWEGLAERVAEVAGRALGRVLPEVRSLPGLAGAAMVSWGIALAYLPAGVIAGGVFLLMLDRRL